RRAAGHRLEHGNPKTFVERRIGDAGRAAIKARQFLVAHLAEPAYAVAADLDAAPAPSADDSQLSLGALDSLDQPFEVLERRERPHGEDVGALLRFAYAGELVADRVRHDADLLVGHPK